MNNEPNPTRKYKRSAPAFKRSAVELWLGGGQSAEQVASELGISVQALKNLEAPTGGDAAPWWGAEPGTTPGGKPPLAA